MKHVRLFTFLISCFFGNLYAQTPTPQITVSFPVERIVFQRNNQNATTFSVAGFVNTHVDRVEARLVPVVSGQGTATGWSTIASNLRNTSFNGQIGGQGGWYSLEVRAVVGNTTVAISVINKVGIGEVFIVGGEVNAQGDSTVSGARIGTLNDRVMTVDYSNLVVNEANLPFTFSQFGNSKKMAATHDVPFFWARFGDLLVQRLNVPVAFYGCGVATMGSSAWKQSADGVDLRATYPNAVRVAGMPYRGMKAVLNYLAVRTGVRSVLWLQGESDVATSNRNYFDNIKTVIDKSRADLNKSDLAWLIARNKKGVAQDSLAANLANVATGPNIDAITGIGNRSGDILAGSGLSQAANAYFGAVTPTYLNTVNPMLPTFIQNINTSCNSSNGNITASIPVGFTNPRWSNSATAQSITINATGTYSAKFFDARGNVYDTAPVFVSSNYFVPTGQVTLLANGPTTICSDKILTLTFPNVQTYNLRVTWSTADTSRTITVPTTGTYSALARTPVGCAVTSNTVNATVNQLPVAPSISSNIGANFCVGQTATLTASGSGAGSTYTWTSIVNNARTTTVAPSIQVQRTGQFYARARSSQGCSSIDSTLLSTIVSPKPATPSVLLSAMTQSNINTFCAGDNVRITATGATGEDFVWNNNFTGAQLPVTQTGSYSVRAQGASGCLSDVSAITNVTIYSNPPNPSITASGPLTFCSNVGVTLSGAGGNASSRYIWDVEVGGSRQSVETNQLSTAQTGKYTLKTANTTNGFTCFSVVSPSVNTISNAQPATPSVAVSPVNTDNTLTYCADRNVSISASGGAGLDYVWNNNANGAQLPITQSGVYAVRARNAAGCLSNQSTLLNITINPNPANPSITASGALEFCADANVTLFGGGGNGARYFWDSDINGNRQTLEASQLTTNQTGRFTLRTVNSFNCSSAIPQTVNTIANALPVVPTVSILPVNTDNSLVYCADRNPTIAATGSSNNYLWSNSSRATGFPITQSSSVSVRAVSDKGCFSPASSTYNFTINPLPAKPVIVPTGPTTFCDYEEVRLNLIGISSNTAGFLWSNGFQIPFVILNQSDVVSVRAKSDNGCFSPSSDPVAVVVNKSPVKPTISASGPTTFCENSQVTLISSVDAAASRYVWSNARTAQAVDINQSGKYAVQLFSREGCRSPVSDSVAIVVNRNPRTPSLTAEGSTRFCPDKSVNLVAVSDANTTFVWNNEQTGRSINVNKAGQYSAQATNENKCISAFSAPISIIVLPAPPAPKIVASPASIVCAGTEVTLSGATAGQVLLWNQQVLGTTVKTNQAASYSAQVFSDEGCSSAPSEVIKVEIKANPIAPKIEQVGTFTLRVNNSQGQNYEWLYSDKPFNKNLATVKTVQDGAYKVRAFATYADGLTCISPYSDVYNLLNGSFFDQQIGIFPNPSVNGVVTIEVAEKRTNVVLEIIRQSGLIVSTKEIGEVNDKVTVDLSEFGRGIYLLRINSSEGVLVKRLMYY